MQILWLFKRRSAEFALIIFNDVRFVSHRCFLVTAYIANAGSLEIKIVCAWMNTTRRQRRIPPKIMYILLLLQMHF